MKNSKKRSVTYATRIVSSFYYILIKVIQFNHFYHLLSHPSSSHKLPRTHNHMPLHFHHPQIHHMQILLHNQKHNHPDHRNPQHHLLSFDLLAVFALGSSLYGHYQTHWYHPNRRRHAEPMICSCLLNLSLIHIFSYG